MSERVDVELEALVRSLLRGLRIAHLPRLEVEHRDVSGLLHHEVVATLDPVALHKERELLLHRGRRPGGLRLLPEEAPQHLLARVQASLLVLAREEALGEPGGLKRRDEILFGKPTPREAGLEHLPHRLVNGVPVDHRVVGEERDTQNVDVAILEGTGLVVVDPRVGQAQELVLGDRCFRRGPRLWGGLVASQRLERPALPWDGSRVGQIERLHHEARDLACASRPVVGGRGQHQLVHGSGHRHVEEPALLVELTAADLDLLTDEGVGERHLLPASLERELRLGTLDEKDDRELEALGLVNGEDVDRVVVEVGLRDRRVVPGLAQQLEVRDEGRHTVVLGHVAVGLHRLEEPGDVPDLCLGPGRGFARQTTKQTRPLQVAVQHLTRTPARHLGRRPLEVGQQPRSRVATLPRNTREVLVLRETPQDLEQRARLAPSVLVETEQLHLRHPVDLGGREVEERDRVLGVGQHLEE